MADLSNITALSGLTITSDQTTGTINPNATFAVSSVTTAQRDLLENVTPYVVNGETVKIKEGTIIFNISVDKLQMFRNGIWENVTANISTATGVGLSSSPFSIPSGPRAEVEVTANQVNGFIYYDTGTSQIRGYINSNWSTVFSMRNSNITGDPTGKGLVEKVPLLVPSGSNADNVIEIEAANQVNGFIYYDTESSRARIFFNDIGWGTLFRTSANATGVGLTNGAPFVYPSGPRGNVEVAANQVDGFTYFDVTNTVLRTYKNAWQTITSA